MTKDETDAGPAFGVLPPDGARPAQAQVLSLVRAATPRLGALARGEVVRLAARHGASASLCEDVALAVSEAVNNAVLHAYGGKGGEVHLVVDVIDDALEILVADQGYGFGEGPKSSGLGVGLRVIAELADTFSIDPGREAGVEVRMRFLLR